VRYEKIIAEDCLNDARSETSKIGIDFETAPLAIKEAFASRAVIKWVTTLSATGIGLHSALPRLREIWTVNHIIAQLMGK